MPDNIMQKCVTISKNNIDVISNALEEYWSHEYRRGNTTNEINEARIRVKKIKDQIEKINEIKICWG